MHALISAVDETQRSRSYGRVTGVHGLLVEIAGTMDPMGIGTRLMIDATQDRAVAAEVVARSEGPVSPWLQGSSASPPGTAVTIIAAPQDAA